MTAQLFKRFIQFPSELLFSATKRNHILPATISLIVISITLNIYSANAGTNSNTDLNDFSFVDKFEPEITIDEGPPTSDPADPTCFPPTTDPNDQSCNLPTSDSNDSKCKTGTSDPNDPDCRPSTSDPKDSNCLPATTDPDDTVCFPTTIDPNIPECAPVLPSTSDPNDPACLTTSDPNDLNCKSTIDPFDLNCAPPTSDPSAPGCDVPVTFDPNSPDCSGPAPIGSTPEPTAEPTATPDDKNRRGKSFTFKCSQEMVRGAAGLEHIVLESGNNEECILKLTNFEPGVQVEVATLKRKGLKATIQVEPVRGITDFSGELEISIKAISRGLDWIAWAVPDKKGKFDFSKRAYDSGTAWGMFVEVK